MHVKVRQNVILYITFVFLKNLKINVIMTCVFLKRTADHTAEKNESQH